MNVNVIVSERFWNVFPAPDGSVHGNRKWFVPFKVRPVVSPDAGVAISVPSDVVFTTVVVVPAHAYVGIPLLTVSSHSW